MRIMGAEVCLSPTTVIFIFSPLAFPFPGLLNVFYSAALLLLFLRVSLLNFRRVFHSLFLYIWRINAGGQIKEDYLFADLKYAYCSSRHIQSEMHLSVESQVVSDCLWDSRKMLILSTGAGKRGGSLGKFRLIFTRLLTDADQICWTKTGVSKVRLSTDLGVLPNEEILTYVMSIFSSHLT